MDETRPANYKLGTENGRPFRLPVKRTIVHYTYEGNKVKSINYTSVFLIKKVIGGKCSNITYNGQGRTKCLNLIFCGTVRSINICDTIFI